MTVMLPKVSSRVSPAPGICCCSQVGSRGVAGGAAGVVAGCGPAGPGVSSPVVAFVGVVDVAGPAGFVGEGVSFPVAGVHAAAATSAAASSVMVRLAASTGSMVSVSGVGASHPGLAGSGGPWGCRGCSAGSASWGTVWGVRVVDDRAASGRLPLRAVRRWCSLTGAVLWALAVGVLGAVTVAAAGLWLGRPLGPLSVSSAGSLALAATVAVGVLVVGLALAALGRVVELLERADSQRRDLVELLRRAEDRAGPGSSVSFRG